MTIVTIVSNTKFLGVSYSAKNEWFTGRFGWWIFDYELSDRHLVAVRETTSGSYAWRGIVR